MTGVTEKNTGNPNRVPGLTLKYRSKQKRAVCLDRIINRGGFSCCPSSRIKPNTRDNVIVRSYSMLCKLMVNHKPLKSSVCNVYRGWSRIFFLRRYDYNVYYPFFFFFGLNLNKQKVSHDCGSHWGEGDSTVLLL